MGNTYQVRLDCLEEFLQKEKMFFDVREMLPQFLNLGTF